jgi:hypothetical protein
MAFTPETDAGLATANSYLSEAEADAYHVERGNTEWSAAVQADKETALVRATDYVDKRFGRKFRGDKGTQAQALQWPRTDAYDNDNLLISGRPEALKRAVSEYAIRALTLFELSPDPPRNVNSQSHVSGVTDPTTPTGSAQSFREKLGPLEEETKYKSAAANIASAGVSSKSSLVSDFYIPEYPAADMWLEELLKSSSTVRLVRG